MTTTAATTTTAMTTATTPSPTSATTIFKLHGTGRNSSFFVCLHATSSC
jgi:hypothetical protein